MIDLYYWPTPNGHKITIFLEEAGLTYKIIPVDIGKGDQFKPDFLKISPNNRMPAIVDQNAEGGPLSIFESGAILLYLAEKTGQFLPKDMRAKYQVLQWLFWQVGGLGPMMGQANHFTRYASEIDEGCDHSYGRERYQNETRRLFGVMDRQLADHQFLAGEYSIADIASWPWARAYKNYDFDIADWPNLKRWHQTMKARPAVRRAIDIGLGINPPQDKLSEEAKKNLFGAGQKR
ncbi:MAG: glutathione S-transferase N-terminal domain-containing protein [Proteobacteria bacterium]|nr:glutathione S-transferase N-terminal domain-containing protein [Pseudomonadota bacterium]